MFVEPDWGEFGRCKLPPASPPRYYPFFSCSAEFSGIFDRQFVKTFLHGGQRQETSSRNAKNSEEDKISENRPSPFRTHSLLTAQSSQSPEFEGGEDVESLLRGDFAVGRTRREEGRVEGEDAVVLGDEAGNPGLVKIRRMLGRREVGREDTLENIRELTLADAF